MTVNGRIDTISVPTLLKVFDECSEGISSVRVKLILFAWLWINAQTANCILQ